MKHTEAEMLALKESIKQMWQLVHSQIELAKRALLNNDRGAALQVVSNEKRVDAFDLKIDYDCEHYIALYSPVAIDLRCVLSLVKISNTLERIGDFAHGIATYLIELSGVKNDDELLQQLDVETMIDQVLGMLADCYAMLQSEETHAYPRVLAKDERIDQIYRSALTILATYIPAHPEQAEMALKLLLVLRKIERMGDHCSNIVEDLVFFIDAKVLKHSNQKGESTQR